MTLLLRFIFKNKSPDYLVKLFILTKTNIPKLQNPRSAILEMIYCNEAVTSKGAVNLYKTKDRPQNTPYSICSPDKDKKGSIILLNVGQKQQVTPLVTKWNGLILSSK